jgi:hypothetical protein
MKALNLTLSLVLICLFLGCFSPPKFNPADKVKITDGKYKYCIGVVINYRHLHPRALVSISCDLFLFNTRDYVYDEFMTKEIK